MSDSLRPHGLQHQGSPSITISRSLLKLLCIESVMPSSHLILGRPLLLLPPIPPSIRVFSNESIVRMRWPKYWSFSFSIIPSKEHPFWSSLEWTGWISLQSKGLSRVLSNTTVQQHRFVGSQPSLWSSSHICTGSRKNRSLTIWTFIDKAMCSLRNALEFQVNRKEMLLSSPQQETVIWEHRSRRVHTRSWSHAGFCDVSSAHFTSFSDN